MQETSNQPGDQLSIPQPAPKPLTASQNVVLTLKIMAVAAIVIGLLWLLEASRN